jgi:hypothetical protein
VNLFRKTVLNSDLFPRSFSKRQSVNGGLNFAPCLLFKNPCPSVVKNAFRGFRPCEPLLPIGHYDVPALSGDVEVANQVHHCPNHLHVCILKVPPFMELELSQLAALRQNGRGGKTHAAVASHALLFETNRAFKLRTICTPARARLAA